MNHKDAFTAWMPKNGVNGNTITSYRAYINQIEKKYGNIDELIKDDMYVLLENINHENFPGKAEHTIRIYRSAVLKYYEFLKSIDEVL